MNEKFNKIQTLGDPLQIQDLSPFVDFFGLKIKVKNSLGLNTYTSVFWMGVKYFYLKYRMDRLTEGQTGKHNAPYIITI